MKVVHVVGGYHPDPMAGTEVYVQSLALALRPLGINSIIAAPDTEDKIYEHNGLRVRRYGMSPDVRDLREIYGHADPSALGSFLSLVEAEQPSVVHFHTRTRTASLEAVCRVKSGGLPVIITYHTPTMSCPRGTLLRWGSEICSGELCERTCTQCMLMAFGVGASASRALAETPRKLGKLIGRLGLSGRVPTALRMHEMIALLTETTRDFYAAADRVIALCNWSHEVLLANGADANRLRLVRHGISGIPHNPPAIRERNGQMAVRLAFLGRIEPIKGLHHIVNAVRALSDAQITLDIYAVHSSQPSQYRKDIEQAVTLDARIRLLDPISNDQIVSALSEYDALVVPSQWLETGPLVVLEAFAAGIPVIGSRLGGIAELVTDGVNGLLVDPFDEMAWRDCLQRIAHAPRILYGLQENVRPPRTVQTVAEEMASIYREVV